MMNKNSGAKVLEWDGSNVPEAFRDLPPGRYTLELVEAWNLSDEDELGLERAIAEADRGEGVSGEEVEEIFRKSLASRKKS